MFTNAQVAALVAGLEAKFDRAIAQGAPAKAKAASPVGPTKFADSPLGQRLAEKRSKRVACVIHVAGVCNRTFNPTNESGIAQHNAELR